MRTIIWRRHAWREAEDENISESMLEDALRKEFVLVSIIPRPFGESALVLVFIEWKPVHVVLSPREVYVIS